MLRASAKYCPYILLFNLRTKTHYNPFSPLLSLIDMEDSILPQMPDCKVIVRSKGFFFITPLLFLLLYLAFPFNISYADGPGVVQMRYAMLKQINQARASYGLYPYQLDNRLLQAAQAHVADRYDVNYHSHRGSNGSNYYQRIRQAGYMPIQANETIGWGYNLDRQVNWWLNSRIHRWLLLSSRYDEIGIGYSGNPNSRGDHWWVVKYARHR